MLKSALISLFQKHCIRPEWHGFYEHVYKLSLRGMGVLNSEGSEATGETWLYQHLQASGIPLETIVDVGANTGGITAELKTYFPDSHYYCFEPNPETYQMLVARHGTDPLVKTYHRAVSDTAATLTLYDFANDAPLKPTQPTATMASLYASVIEDFHGQPAKSYEVKSITLDAWAKKEKLDTVDYLKIDTEGHELAVLQGAKRLIQDKKLGLVQFEFNEMHAYSHTFMRDIQEVLVDYSLLRLLPHGYIVLDHYRPLTHEIFGFQNIVAVPDRLRTQLELKT